MMQHSGVRAFVIDSKFALSSAARFRTHWFRSLASIRWIAAKERSMRVLCLILSATVASSLYAQTTQPVLLPPKPATPNASTQPSQLPPEQMLNQMLRPNNSGPKPLQPVVNPPDVDKTSGKAAVAPAATTQQLRREGDWIRDKVGRLTKGSDGQTWEFTFDSDGRTMQDPPVVILPNLKLMQMENAVTGSNRDLKFRVTGMVTEYKGRNYILLEKAMVESDTGNQF
jgi:hypothetical protein